MKMKLTTATRSAVDKWWRVCTSISNHPKSGLRKGNAARGVARNTMNRLPGNPRTVGHVLLANSIGNGNRQNRENQADQY